MDNKIVIVGNEATPFARYIKRLGMDVYVARRSRSGVEVTETEDCEAIYWDMETIVRPRMRALARSLLLSVPKECVKILDFNLKEIDEERQRLVRLSLECCDLMKIDQREFSVLCDMLGLTSPHAFDNEFDLIGQFEAIYVVSERKRVLIVASDIVYMESMGNYVYLNLTGGRQIKTQATLTSLVAQLPAGEFIRIHKSYVVARRHILKFSGRQLWVDGVMLPIGRAYSKSLKDLEF